MVSAEGPLGVPSVAVPDLQPPAEIFPGLAARRTPTPGMSPLPRVYHTPQSIPPFQEDDLMPGGAYRTPAGPSTRRAEEDEVDRNISPSVSILPKTHLTTHRRDHTLRPPGQVLGSRMNSLTMTDHRTCHSAPNRRIGCHLPRHFRLARGNAPRRAVDRRGKGRHDDSGRHVRRCHR